MKFLIYVHTIISSLVIGLVTIVFLAHYTGQFSFSAEVTAGHNEPGGFDIDLYRCVRIGDENYISCIGLTINQDGMARTMFLPGEGYTVHQPFD